MSDGTKTLYERLGGYDAIAAVANDLLPRLRSGARSMYRSIMVSQLSETSSSDRGLVDPASCRLGARRIPSVERSSAGLLPHYEPSFCVELPEAMRQRDYH
jgi:hypothetical protein